ncbi:MAG: hypothetical protein F6K41_05950 [Symploca sp. SIO3E6]|nr:hypothetical protein [Caldora sp. SIO3E6]
MALILDYPKESGYVLMLLLFLSTDHLNYNLLKQRSQILQLSLLLEETIWSPLASCLLPPASCLLPLASCLLPPASCLLPPASCLLRTNDS